MTTQSKILENYSKIRSEFLDLQAENHRLFLNDLFVTRYLPHIKAYKDRSILEIGCNKGYMIEAMKKQGFKNIVGIDLDATDVETAKKNTGLLEIYSADVFDYLNGSSKFDVIICKDVMEHIAKDKQEKFVRAIYESLNPEGMAIIQVPNMDWLFSNHERYMDFTHEIGYTRESFADIFRLHFGPSRVQILPASYAFTTNWKTKILFGFVRPIVLKIIRLFLRILSEGAEAVWFEHREIMAVVKK